MKIVVFAAGEGVRMRPLTVKTPKPLLVYRGQTNLDHLFSLLPPQIDEAIITVRHLAEQVKAYCGQEFHGRKIHYVDGSLNGNAIGFLAARPFFTVGERFAVAYGDEVFAGSEITRCFEHNYSWICYPVVNPSETGVATLDDRGRIIDMEEKPQKPKSNLAADGFMIVNADIFDYKLQKHHNGEYYFSDLMKEFIKNHETMAVLGDKDHGQLTTPQDIECLNGGTP